MQLNWNVHNDSHPYNNKNKIIISYSICRNSKKIFNNNRGSNVDTLNNKGKCLINRNSEMKSESDSVNLGGKLSMNKTINENNDNKAGKGDNNCSTNDRKTEKYSNRNYKYMKNSNPEVGFLHIFTNNNIHGVVIKCNNHNIKS